MRECDDGTRSPTPDIYGVRDLDDGIDAAWSRNCDLLISDDLYAEMVEAGDRSVPERPPDATLTPLVGCAAVLPALPRRGSTGSAADCALVPAGALANHRE